MSFIDTIINNLILLIISLFIMSYFLNKFLDLFNEIPRSFRKPLKIILLLGFISMAIQYIL